MSGLFLPILAATIGDIVEQINNAAPIPGVTPTAAQKRWQRLALRMVKRFLTGQVILVRATSIVNPVDATDTATQYEATQSVNAHTEGYSDEERAKDPMIHAGDRKIYIAAKGLNNVPKRKEFVLISNVPHSIENVRQIPADGPVALYILQARTAA